MESWKFNLLGISNNSLYVPQQAEICAWYALKEGKALKYQRDMYSKCTKYHL